MKEKTEESIFMTAFNAEKRKEENKVERRE